MTTYSYTKTPVSIDRLTVEVRSSSIVTALDHMNLLGSELDIVFRADLSDDDKSTLDAIIAAHSGEPLIENKVSQVQTQFESKDKTLKLFCAQADVGSDGIATIMVPIPGTPGSDGRWIEAGEAFFDAPTAGDRVLGVWFIDHDNISGAGADAVIGSYTDDAAPADNQGWYLPPVRGTIKAETIGFYGFAPSGFYIRISAKKANGITTGKFFINLEWAVTG